MPRSILSSLGWWISLAAALGGATACQNRAPSLRMLDTRAGYDAALEDEEVALYQRARRQQDSLALRSGPRVARVYIYPHELPTRDYFWGGYVSLVVSGEEWSFENPEDAEPAAAIREVKKAKNQRDPARSRTRERARKE